MSHVSQNLANLAFGPSGLTDALLYDVRSTQDSETLTPGSGVVIAKATGPITFTLPQSRTCKGRAFLIVNATGKPVTVVGQDMHDLINNARSVTLNTQYTGLLVLSDGQGWWGLTLL